MKCILVMLLFCAGTALTRASESVPALSKSPPSEDEFYRIETIPVPKEAVLEVGGLCWMSDVFLIGLDINENPATGFQPPATPMARNTLSISTRSVLCE